jgi:hypothetical protein
VVLMKNERRVILALGFGLLGLALLSCGGPPTVGGSAPTAAGGARANQDVAVPAIEGPAASAGRTPSVTDIPTVIGQQAEQDIEEWSPPSADILAAIDKADDATGDLPMLRPRELPPCSRLAGEWRPLDREPAASTSGEERALENPWIAGGGTDYEVRILLEVGENAWVELITGVRGDMGELPGRAVSLRGDLTGMVYDVLGGHFVQWQSNGTAHAVFAVGLSEQDTVRVARSSAPAG